MKETDIRLFVAAPLPELHQAALQQYAARFAHDAVRMVPQQNLHLTLYFIGNIAPKLVPPLIRQLATLSTLHHCFNLQLQEVGPGPSLKHPRLIWARYAASEAFGQLSQAVSEQLEPGKPQKLKPIPHVTLARYRKDRKPPHFDIQPAQEPLVLPVQSLALWQSKIRHPHPEYTILEEFPLVPNF